MKKLLLSVLLAFLGIGLAMADNVVYKELYFGSTTNSKSVQDYTTTWYATVNGFRGDIVNFNNNQNGWSSIKCGSKKAASVATITNNAAIDKPITQVTLTLGAVTTANVNSIKLYVSDSKTDYTGAVAYDIEASEGAKVVTITNPAANKFYKLEFDCKQGSGNGFVEVTKVEYFVADETGSTPKADPEISFSAATAEATMGEEFTAPTLTNTNNVTVTYSSSNESVATVNATSGAVTLVAAGTTDITATFAGNDDYKAATASYTLKVNAAAVTPPAPGADALVAGKCVFYESFDSNNGKGANDDNGWGKDNSSIAQNAVKFEQKDWESESTTGAYHCIKLGVSKSGGYATTPALGLNAENTYILTFKAGSWYNDGASVTLSIVGNGTLSQTSFALDDSAWGDYSVTITGADEETKVKFETTAGKKRFFLDEVRVSEAGYAVTIGETGYATLYYGEKNLEVPAGVEAWTYVANTAGALTAKKSYHSGDIKVIPAGEAVLLYTKTPATYVFNVKATAGEPEEENHLMGTDAEQVVTADEGKTNYFLAKGSKGVGFYKVDDTGTHTNGAHKAYLSIATPAGAPAMVALPGAEDVDGIVVISIDNVDADNNMYDIMGRPVNADYKGLVIKNGKKFINK